MTLNRIVNRLSKRKYNEYPKDNKCTWKCNLYIGCYEWCTIL